MSFYLQYVAGYSREDQPTEWIDESTYGTIVHEVLENVYGSLLKDSPNGVLVEASTIDGFLNRNDRTIQVLTTRAINRNFLNLPDDRLDFSLSGQNKLTGSIVAQYVRKLWNATATLPLSCIYTGNGARGKRGL